MTYFCFILLFLLFSISKTNQFPTSKNAEKQCFIKVTMTNPHEIPLEILSCGTPFERGRLSGSYFKVMLEKEELEYYGPAFFRGPSTIEDYLVFRPLEAWTEVINICEYYDLTRIGTYQIQLVRFGFPLDGGRNRKRKSYSLEMSLDNKEIEVLNDLPIRWSTPEMERAEIILPASFENSNVIEVIVDAWNRPKHPLEIQRE